MIKETVIETKELSLVCDRCEGRMKWIDRLSNGNHLYKCVKCNCLESAFELYPQNRDRKVIEFDEYGRCCRCHRSLDGVSWRKILHSKALALCGKCSVVMVPEEER